METTTLNQAVAKSFTNAEKHIAGFTWAKENNVNTKDHKTLNDDDYDKMENAVNNNIIDMDVFNNINNGMYKVMSKYDI